MSILIKDMVMPERCLECPLYDNYNYYCTLYSFGIPARHNRDGSTRPEWCDLEELPSAQPDIIRCGECKHYQFADNRAFGMPVKRCEWTGFEDVDDDDFCSRAERR